MNFKQAVLSGFSKYAKFDGRASRSEFWYWILFYAIAVICVSLLDGVVFPENDNYYTPFFTILSLLFVLPNLSVLARRLHDIDKSAWWMFISFVPIIGLIILIVWEVRKGDEGANRFGEDPLSGGAAEATPPVA